MGNLASKEKSRIKMVALTQGSAKNIVWYSPEKQNHETDDKIISGMLRRFEKLPIYKQTNCIRFYAVASDTLLAQYNAM